MLVGSMLSRCTALRYVTADRLSSVRPIACLPNLRVPLGDAVLPAASHTIFYLDTAVFWRLSDIQTGL